jgi:hypothetical protein
MSLSTDPIKISPSQSELKVGALTQRNLEIATRALHRDGMVVIEKLIPETLLDRLNEKMVKDALELQARKDTQYNNNKGYIQQDPPLTADWFSEEIYFSKLNTFRARFIWDFIILLNSPLSGDQPKTAALLMIIYPFVPSSGFHSSIILSRSYRNPSDLYNSWAVPSRLLYLRQHHTSSNYYLVSNSSTRPHRCPL